MARLRGNRWQSDVLVDGRRVRKSFATQEEAEAYELQHSGKVNPKHTLKSYSEDNFDAIWGNNRHQETQRKLLRSLYRSFGPETQLAELTTVRVDEEIVRWKKEGLSASTINSRLATLSKLFKYAYTRDVITRLPMLNRQSVDNLLERVWTKDDEHKAFLFLDHCGLETTRWVLQFLLYTGARRGEAYKLTRKSVKDGWITFDRTTTKNGCTRVIKMVPKAQEAWDNLCKATDDKYPLNAVNPWTLTAHWKVLRRHFGALDDRAFVPHMLRHTCATRLVQAGVPLAQVMKWMGHKSIQVTMRYVTVSPDDLDFAAQALAA